MDVSVWLLPCDTHDELRLKHHGMKRFPRYRPFLGKWWKGLVIRRFDWFDFVVSLNKLLEKRTVWWRCFEIFAFPCRCKLLSLIHIYSMYFMIIIYWSNVLKTPRSMKTSKTVYAGVIRVWLRYPIIGVSKHNKKIVRNSYNKCSELRGTMCFWHSPPI